MALTLRSILLLSLTLWVALTLTDAKKDKHDSKEKHHDSTSTEDQCEIKSSIDDLFGTVRSVGQEVTKLSQNVNNIFDRFGKELLEIKKQLTETKSAFDQCGCSNGITATDCADLYKSGETDDGVYQILVPGSIKPISVYCDMETDGGGWTVIQRRGNYGNKVDYFYRGWNQYKKGFGELKKEHWLGNNIISAMTMKKKYNLRVDLWDLNNTHVYAPYRIFSLDNENSQYALNIGGFTGDIDVPGDSMGELNHQSFTTKDRDNGPLEGEVNCAELSSGAWWYQGCGGSNLNGLNLRGYTDQKYKGIIWYTWKGFKYSLLSTTMKIRPDDF